MTRSGHGWPSADPKVPPNRLLATFERNPDSLDIEQQKLAAVLKEIAATGDVPVIRMPAPNTGLRDRKAMLALARHLFVIDADLGPLLTLAVGLSGRNSETIKDLRAEHEILENKAVRAELIKRRRGPGHTFATAHWGDGCPLRRRPDLPMTVRRKGKG